MTSKMDKICTLTSDYQTLDLISKDISDGYILGVDIGPKLSPSARKQVANAIKQIMNDIETTIEHTVTGAERNP